MSKQRVLENMFSNLTNLFLTVGLAFVVSPIIVHSLGNENYGIWTLIASITGYFTVLDFGVNTALVRFISMYEAQGKRELAREIYSTSFMFFSVVCIIIVLFTVIFAFFFRNLFNIQSLSNTYLYYLFVLVGTELAVSLVFSVFLGTLRALQEFLRVNIISISTLILKNVVLVIMLLNGYSLLTMAVVQLAASAGNNLVQYITIRSQYGHLRFRKSDFNKMVFRKIFDYSLYSFIIAVALKVLFFTDSVVIGLLISVSAVTFYAIPMTLMTYLERFVYAVMSVLTPVISANEAIGDNVKNREIYVLGTKYSLMFSLPILFVLFTNGDSFISVWMGAEYGLRGGNVLKILVVGYIFYLSQVIANGILKGMSRHKVFAFILTGEAIANLLISIMLARYYGIEGVALGTTLPLVITNLVLVPVYTCRVLGLPYISYLVRCYKNIFIISLILALGYLVVPIKISTYLQLAGYSVMIAIIFLAFSIRFVLEKEHRAWMFNVLRTI